MLGALGRAQGMSCGAQDRSKVSLPNPSFLNITSLPPQGEKVTNTSCRPPGQQQQPLRPAPQWLPRRNALKWKPGLILPLLTFMLSTPVLTPAGILHLRAFAHTGPTA